MLVRISLFIFLSKILVQAFPLEELDVKKELDRCGIPRPVQTLEAEYVDPENQPADPFSCTLPEELDPFGKKSFENVLFITRYNLFL